MGHWTGRRDKQLCSCGGEVRVCVGGGMRGVGDEGMCVGECGDEGMCVWEGVRGGCVWEGVGRGMRGGCDG